ncbi:Hypothetical protein BRZCDTV_268 [Brazilian cedratvirus IHUMI]|uniref:Uncharacterized protein n=1 Tax=Brazilian cedratvirus IHUMI TaxID=2126980 RepID=A0A2R8FE77_9VIRU|nr:Hypothetical protein BRZCDTV_268 [Brazilian cedratvirus IHUMI]
MLRPKTLKGCVLSTFSYEETKQVCLEYPSLFSSPWYESWVWREKAISDFGISERFFDLVPNLAPSQRYLQLKSYVTLTPDMLFKDGEGVYEAKAGYRKAVELDNKEMQKFFLNGKYPKQEKKPCLKSNPLNKKIKKGIREGGNHEDLLIDILMTGRVDWLDQVLHRYFVLPQGFSIARDVPHVPFWSNTFPLLHHLPVYRGSLNVHSIMVHAIATSNGRIVDFFRSIFREQVQEEIHNFYLYNKMGLELSKNPEETFAIHRRFKQPDMDIEAPFMVEQFLDLADDYDGAIMYEPGNITTLQSVLPFLSREDIENLYISDDYPVTQQMLG